MLFSARIVDAKCIHGHRFDFLLLHRAVTEIRRDICDLIYDIHALDDFAECSISAIQMQCILVHDEELGACGVGLLAQAVGDTLPVWRRSFLKPFWENSPGIV